MHILFFPVCVSAGRGGKAGGLRYRDSDVEVVVLWSMHDYFIIRATISVCNL